ncbi:TolB family protein [Sphaerisporangium dianthi]|uniref:TolB family protein n=1 Tax=Sphaerisporangium dianthi TaxID=1436120 RepID=A0ABV9CA55_9ACTN
MNRHMPLGAILGTALLTPMTAGSAGLLTSAHPAPPAHASAVTLAASAVTLAAPGVVPAALGAAPAAAPRPLAGVAVYARYDRGYIVTRYQPRKGFTRLGVAPEPGQFSASPDGEKVTWITPRGQVQVSAAGKVTTIAKGAGMGAPCLTPIWSPDSTKVAFPSAGDTDARPIVIANADGTGDRKAGTTTGVCHLAWSGDGRHLAGYTGTTEGVVRLDLRTRRSVKVKGVKLANHVQSLSPHGEKVVIHALSPADPGGDGAWPTEFRPTIVDTTIGRKVPIPVRGRLIGALYLPDGRLVVRVAGPRHNTLVVLDASGRRLQRLAEPPAARTQALLQIVR